MNLGPNYPYTDAMDQCGICDKHLPETSTLGFFLVPNRGAICYPLCKRCSKIARKGLPPDQLRKLDQKMLKRAAELGLTQTQ